jgi:hypothetical protein
MVSDLRPARPSGGRGRLPAWVEALVWKVIRRHLTPIDQEGKNLVALRL